MSNFPMLQIIYGGLDEDGPRQEEETLARRTRGRKINYQDIMGSDSEEVFFSTLILHHRKKENVHKP